MKYLLLALTFLVVGEFSRAADTLTVDGKKYTAVDTSKLNWNTVYADTKEALKGIGAALKVGSEHVYAIVVKQQVTESIIYLITDIILLLMAYIFWRLFLKDYRRFSIREDPWYTDEIADHTTTILYLLLGLVCIAGAIIVLLGTLRSIVIGFTNPEYGALKDIMEMIHPAPKQ